ARLLLVAPLAAAGSLDEMRRRHADPVADLLEERQSGRVALGARRRLALFMERVSQVVERDRLAAPVADLAADRELPLVVLPRLLEPALGGEDAAGAPRAAARGQPRDRLPE